MHEESHEVDQTYDDDDTNFNRPSRFGIKNQHGARSSVLEEFEANANDTYQDIDDDGSDNDQMESRAEYNSEEDDGIDGYSRNARESRLH